MENPIIEVGQQDMSVTQVEASIARMTAVQALVGKYITDNLTDGVDFGAIKGFTDKKSLFKPGAEKMCNLFQLRPVFTRDDDTWEMAGKPDGSFFYLCNLIDKQGNVWGEGRGAETKGAKSRDVNAAIKIAEKRAQVDAVLRTFALSERFTQDVEDIAVEQHEPRQSREFVMSGEEYQERIVDNPKNAQFKAGIAIVSDPNATEDWRSTIFPFGTNKGRKLGEMLLEDLKYWIEKYEPKPFRGRITDKDLALRHALNLAGREIAAAHKVPTPTETIIIDQEPLEDDEIMQALTKNPEEYGT